MLHPLTTIEFLLPMIAPSLLAGQQRRTSAIAMLVTFPVSLAIGAVAGMPIHLTSVASWIDLWSMAAFGLLVAAARPLLPGLAAALSMLLGLSIGLADGAEARRPSITLSLCSRTRARRTDAGDLRHWLCTSAEEALDANWIQGGGKLDRGYRHFGSQPQVTMFVGWHETLVPILCAPSKACCDISALKSNAGCGPGGLSMTLLGSLPVAELPCS
jgi:hypothetical protein